MKNNIKWIIIAITFVVLIGGATILYNNLSEDFGGDVLLTNTTEVVSNSNESEPNREKMKAPDFTVLDYDGNEVKLSDYKGKPVVLNFWATWCFYCKEEMPDFNLAYEKYPDIEFLMVNATDGYQETVEKAKQYYEDEGFDFNIYFDTNMDAVTNYGLTGYPATFFIDEEGYLEASAGGMIDYEMLEKGINIIRN